MSRAVLRTGRQQAVGAVRRYRRAGGQEHPQPRTRLHGGDAAGGRDLRQAGVKKPARPQPPPNWMWPAAVTVVCLAAIGVGGFLYLTKLEMMPAAKGAVHRQQHNKAGGVTATVAGANADGSGAAFTCDAAPTRNPDRHAGVSAGESCGGATALIAAPNRIERRFVPDAMPFVGSRTRTALASEYLPAPMPRRSPPPSTASMRSWSASRRKTQQRVPRSSSVRSAWNKPRCRANARSTPSAIPWFIRMASRRFRRCHGSGTIFRSSGHSSPTKCR